MRAGAQPAFLPQPSPAVPVVLHDVFVIPQRARMQQSIHSDGEYLYEAAELDDGGDQALESLPDAVAQVRALEERRDEAIRLVRALLELREALAQWGERFGLVARPCGILG